MIGSYLLKILLENNHKVYVLSRDRDNKNAKERVDDALRFWNKGALKKSVNLIVLEGDLTKKDLGFNQAGKEIFEKKIEEIFHCAALTKFNQSLDGLLSVNVEGVRNLLELSLSASRKSVPKKINHISTIYICGNYPKVFKEVDLDVGQEFYTNYERSKFEAEKLIEHYRNKGLAIDILRLGGIVGESGSGKINYFKNFYQLIKLLSSGILDVFPIKKSMPVNLSCVDVVAAAIYHLSQNTKLKNKNYHLFSRNTITKEEAYNIVQELVGFDKPVMISWDKFKPQSLTPAQQKLIKEAVFISTITDAKVDSSFTMSMLKKCNFRFPDFTADQFSLIVKYAIESGFVKRKF